MMKERRNPIRGWGRKIYEDSDVLLENHGEGIHIWKFNYRLEDWIHYGIWRLGEDCWAEFDINGNKTGRSAKDWEEIPNLIKEKYNYV